MDCFSILQNDLPFWPNSTLVRAKFRAPQSLERDEHFVELMSGV